MARVKDEAWGAARNAAVAVNSAILCLLEVLHLFTHLLDEQLEFQGGTG